MNERDIAIHNSHCCMNIVRIQDTFNINFSDEEHSILKLLNIEDSDIVRSSLINLLNNNIKKTTYNKFWRRI
jgi:hypothetical protein